MRDFSFVITKDYRQVCRAKLGMPVVKFMVRLFKSAVGTTDVLSLLQSFSLLWFNILRKFRAIALHYPPMFCRSYGT